LLVKAFIFGKDGEKIRKRRGEIKVFFKFTNKELIKTFSFPKNKCLIYFGDWYYTIAEGVETEKLVKILKSLNAIFFKDFILQNLYLLKK